MIHDLLARAISAVTGLSLPAASSSATETDYLLLSLIGGTILVLALVFGLMLRYVAKYAHGTEASRSVADKTWGYEVSWTIATMVIFFGLFIWGANLYVRLFQPPAGAMRIAITGKQWMWKAEHEGGQAEINALHVPMGRPIELLMTSEDVIHDFSIPAFRIKHDVLPNRYTALWFTAVQEGTYNLFCTQYCGTDHSVMGGKVTVMQPVDYARWLETVRASPGLVPEGRALFSRLGCSGCHQADWPRGSVSTVRAPPLAGLYGQPVPLGNGTVVIADDQYIRDSILMPSRQVVAGYANRMPSFSGVVSEADLVRLLAYIKSMAADR